MIQTLSKIVITLLTIGSARNWIVDGGADEA